jgi:hypothetical protein
VYSADAVFLGAASGRRERLRNWTGAASDVAVGPGWSLPFPVLCDNRQDQSKREQQRSANNPGRLRQVTVGKSALVHKQRAQTEEDQSKDNRQVAAHEGFLVVGERVKGFYQFLLVFATAKVSIGAFILRTDGFLYGFFICAPQRHLGFARAPVTGWTTLISLSQLSQ